MSSSYIITSDGNFISEDELYHYGVKGMKWGVRRYQNPDGTLTSAGKKKARQEYKEDNKKAFELGKEASVYGHAAAKSMNRTIKIENKLDKQYEKDPEGINRRTQALRKKWNASSKTSAQLAQAYAAARDAGEKHCESLIDKYGKDAIRPIKYKDIKLKEGKYSPSSFRTINEETNSVSDYAINAGLSLTTVALNMMGVLPIAVLSSPSTTSQKASSLETKIYDYNLRDERRNKP